jgi:ubiquinone/menaquinone biosynthesis C-methylase UbiE
MLGLGRREKPHMLAVGMTSVKMGDRLVQIGCADGGRLGAIAAGVGLSGRAVAVVPDEAAAKRARKGAADAGVLIEIEVADPTALPHDDGAFDLAVVDDTAGLFATMSDADRHRAVSEMQRVLRPGGRVMVIGTASRAGIGALLAGGPGGSPFDPRSALEAGGFKTARKLAERDGLAFVEGMKPRT